MTFIALQRKRTKSPYFDGCLRCIFKASLKIKAVVGGKGGGIVYLLHETLPRAYTWHDLSSWKHVFIMTQVSVNGITFPYFSLGWVECTLTQHHFTCKMTFEILLKTNCNSRQSHDNKMGRFFLPRNNQKKLHVSFPITFEKRLHKLEKILPKLFSQDKFSEPLYIERR